MRIEQQPAYILHVRPYRETSLLLECLTCAYGRLGIVARSARRPGGRWQRGQLELFQPLLLDLTMHGELATLTGVDTPSGACRLYGKWIWAGLYLNELVMRLTARYDAMPELFAAYALTLVRLGQGQNIAWTLRRSERDLFQILGYALQLQFEADSGEPLVAQGCYRYDVEQGPIRLYDSRPGSLRGTDLLDLAADRCPDDVGLVALRDMVRTVICFYLGGRPLRAWCTFSGTFAPFFQMHQYTGLSLSC